MLVLDHLDVGRAVDPHGMHILVDERARFGRWHLLFGRRLIVLVVTDNPHLELGVVGGENVGWNPHEQLLAHRDGSRLPPWIAAG